DSTGGLRRRRPGGDNRGPAHRRGGLAARRRWKRPLQRGGAGLRAGQVRPGTPPGRPPGRQARPRAPARRTDLGGGRGGRARPRQRAPAPAEPAGGGGAPEGGRGGGAGQPHPWARARRRPPAPRARERVKVVRAVVRLGLLVVLLAVAACAYLAFSPYGDAAPHPFNQNRNAVWLEHRWLEKPHSEEEMEQMFRFLDHHGIVYAYPHL